MQSPSNQVFSWLQNHQMLLGILLAGMGTLIVALSAVVKTKAEKTNVDRKKGDERERARVKRRNLWFGYFTMLILGILLSGVGTWLVKRSGDEANATTFLEQKAERARDAVKWDEKFQNIQIALKAAKTEDSQKLTEAKIELIRADISDWAANLKTNLGEKKKEFAQAKADRENAKVQAANKEIQEQIQITSQIFGTFSFALRFLEESVRAYARELRKEKEIDIERMSLPENLFASPTNYQIKFNTNAVWRIQVGGQELAPSGTSLKISFLDAKGKQLGWFRLMWDRRASLIDLIYLGEFPDPRMVNGQHALTNSESAVRAAMQRIIEAQLVQAEPK